MERKMEREMKRGHLPLRIVIALMALIACGNGCTEFCESTDKSNGLTEVHFDESLPEAFEGVFAECNDPLVIEEGISSIELIDGCSFSDLDTTGEMVLALGLASASPVDLGGEIPSHVYSDSWVYDDFPWPVQNCEVTTDVDVFFESLQLTDLQAKWTTRSGYPAMHVDFDFTENTVGHIEINVDVDCPNGLSEALVKAFTKKMRNAMNGSHTINASNRDLDIYITLDNTPTDIIAEMDLDFDVGNLWIDLDWSAVSAFIDPDDIEEPARQLFEDMGDLLLEDALADVPDMVADGIESTLNPDHEICSVKRETDGITITTDEPGGPMTCIGLTVKKAPESFLSKKPSKKSMSFKAKR